MLFKKARKFQATLSPRGAGSIGPPGDTSASGAVLPTPSGSNALPELNISRSDRSISVMEFLVPRNTNLQSKQKAPLASIDNVIDLPATESESVIGGVIVHVRPAIDTTPPSQIPPQDSLSLDEFMK